MKDGNRKPKPRPDLGPLLLLAAFALAVHGRFLFQGVGFLYADVITMYRPVHGFAIENLLDGGAFWCPLLGQGHPPLGAGETPIFYPPALLAYLAFGFDLGQAVLLPLHTYLASVLAYFLGRRMGLSRPASVLAGLAYAWSGWTLGHLPHPMLLWSAAWLPGIFLSLEQVFRNRSRGFPVLPAVCVAGLLLAAAFPVALIAAVATAVWLVVRLLAFPERPRPRDLLRGLGSAALGAGLAAVLILPVLQHVPESIRGHDLAEGHILGISLPPKHLVTVVSPYLLGYPELGAAPDHLRYFGGGAFHELCAYVGGLTLLLGLFALRRGPGRRTAVLLLLAFAACLFVAMGRHTPVGRLVAATPGLSSFRVLPRFLLPGTLALALLGGLGLDAVLRAPERMRRRSATLLIALGALAAAAALALLLLEGTIVSAARDWIRSNVIGKPGHEASEAYYLAWPERLLVTIRDGLWRPALIALAAGVVLRLGRRAVTVPALVAIVAVDLATFHLMYMPPREAPAESNVAEALQSLGIRNAYTVHRRAADDLRAHTSLRHNVPVRYGLATPSVESELKIAAMSAIPWDARPTEVAEGRRELDAAQVASLRRAGVEAIVHDRTEGELRAPGTTPVAVEDGFEILRIRGAAPRVSCRGGSAEILEESPTRLVLRVEASAASELVVRDAYASGWSATVDGDAADVLPAPGPFRTVAVPAGRSRVELSYVPPGLAAGAAVSGVSLLVLLVLAIRRRR